MEQHIGVSLTKLLVSTAADDISYYEHLKLLERQDNYVTLQAVFSKGSDIFDRLYIYIALEIEKYVIWTELVVKEGDHVAKGINVTDAVTFIDMQF